MAGPLALVPVHVLVGRGQEVGGVVAALVEGRRGARCRGLPVRQADRRPQRHLVAGHHDVGVEQLGGALDDALGLVRGDVGQEHGELVPGEPGDEIVDAHRPRQPAGRLHQQCVAGEVPELVVDLLELVEVDQHDRALPAVGEHVGEPAREQRPVGDAREGVVRRLVGEGIPSGRQAPEQAAGAQGDEDDGGHRPEHDDLGRHRWPWAASSATTAGVSRAAASRASRRLPLSSSSLRRPGRVTGAAGRLEGAVGRVEADGGQADDGQDVDRADPPRARPGTVQLGRPVGARSATSMTDEGAGEHEHDPSDGVPQRHAWLRARPPAPGTARHLPGGRWPRRAW